MRRWRQFYPKATVLGSATDHPMEWVKKYIVCWVSFKLEKRGFSLSFMVHPATFFRPPEGAETQSERNNNNGSRGKKW